MTSPFRSAARITSSSPTVALQTQMQCRTPRNPAILRSNSWTSGPLFDNHRRSSISFVRSRNRSRLAMLGRPTCRGCEKAGGAPKIAILLSRPAELPLFDLFIVRLYVTCCTFVLIFPASPLFTHEEDAGAQIGI